MTLQSIALVLLLLYLGAGIGCIVTCAGVIILNAVREERQRRASLEFQKQMMEYLGRKEE